MVALTVMMLALTFAAAPAMARAQEAPGIASTTQFTETQQDVSQEKDKTEQDKDKTGQHNDKKDQKKEEKPDDSTNPKNDWIFLVIPNYGTVEHPTANVPPLTVKQKFKTGAEDAFDTHSIPLAGVVAAISQAKNDDAAWGQGWGAFGKRYAATYGDTVIGSFMTTGVYPSLLKEDPPLFPCGHRRPS